jgi:3-isopropylmalate/(R)-2-methylmalate dehydratase small subunit
VLAIMGRAWKFNNNISTDDITPGRYIGLRSNLSELAKHIFEDTRKEFYRSVRQDDFIVAGRNFGMGSSREHAPIIIKMCGVGAVLAQSFARIFYRNAINIGLAVIVCDTTGIDDGDELEFHLSEGFVRNLTKKNQIAFSPMSKTMEAILNEGGLIAYVQKYNDLVLS